MRNTANTYRIHYINTRNKHTDSPNTRNTADAQNSLNTRNTPNPQDSLNTKNTADTQNSPNTRNTPDTQPVDSLNTRNTTDTQPSLNYGSIHVVHVSACADTSMV